MDKLSGFKRSDGPFVKALDTALSSFNVERQAYYSGTFVGNHVHRCLKVLWQTQVENEHYSTLSGLIQLVISLECSIEITPDCLCSFMND